MLKRKFEEAMGFCNFIFNQKNFKRMKNSTFPNLFMNRDIIINLFNENDVSFQAFVNIYDKRRVVMLYNFNGVHARQNKIEINKVLRNLGFSVHKNTIELETDIPLNSIDLSYSLIKKFKNFFKPIWVEKDNGYEWVSDINSVQLTYSTIYKKKDILVVDGYSSDLFSGMNSDILEYVFFKGTDEEVKSCLASLSKPDTLN